MSSELYSEFVGSALPLFSAGGSNLLANLIGLGIVTNVLISSIKNETLNQL